MERPVDAVTAAVLNLQMAQRAVDDLIHELVERVSADPFAVSSYPDARFRLSELRSGVDQAADELIDAWARMAETVPPEDPH